MIVLIANIIFAQPSRLGNYIFPDWTKILSAFLVLMAVLFIPTMAIYQTVKRGKVSDHFGRKSEFWSNKLIFTKIWIVDKILDF